MQSQKVEAKKNEEDRETSDRFIHINSYFRNDLSLIERVQIQLRRTQTNVHRHKMINYLHSDDYIFMLLMNFPFILLPFFSSSFSVSLYACYSNVQFFLANHFA